MVPGLSIRIIALLVALTIGFGGGWLVQGWRLGADIESLKADYADARAKAAEKTREAEEAAREAEQAAQERSDAIAEAAQARRQAQQAKAKTITREVIKYVQSDDAGKCSLPASWVRVHDKAAAGRTGGVSKASSTTGELDGLASAVTDFGAVNDLIGLGVGWRYAQHRDGELRYIPRDRRPVIGIARVGQGNTTR